jgi:hypothetical protein
MWSHLFCFKAPKKRPKIISNERINLNLSVKNNEKIDYYEIKSLRKQLKKVHERLHKETEKIKELHMELTDYKRRDENLTNINMKLQRKIISFFDHAKGRDQRLSIYTIHNIVLKSREKVRFFFQLF